MNNSPLQEHCLLGGFREFLFPLFCLICFDTALLRVDQTSLDWITNFNGFNKDPFVCQSKRINFCMATPSRKHYPM